MTNLQSNEIMRVGDGMTVTGYSDNKACTVIAVSRSGKTVTLQRDKATLLNGFKSGEPDALVMTPGGFAGHTEGVQRYDYEADPDGERFKVTYRESLGGYKRAGIRPHERGGSAFRGRNEYYDYNF